jgi:hypothetical protein
MKTITLTLCAAGIVLAQSSSSNTDSNASSSNASSKTNSSAQSSAQSKSQNTKAAAKKSNDPQTKEVAKPEPPVQTIPAGAKQIAPNLYQLTDSNGKTWNYRQTPFGINKWEDTGDPAAQAAPQPTPQSTAAKPDPITFTDLGDSYRFERKTPFGANTWVRKKSELSDDEKALVSGAQAGSNPDSSKSPSKPAGN